VPTITYKGRRDSLTNYHGKKKGGKSIGLDFGREGERRGTSRFAKGGRIKKKN